MAGGADGGAVARLVRPAVLHSTTSTLGKPGCQGHLRSSLDVEILDREGFVICSGVEKSPEQRPLDCPYLSVDPARTATEEKLLPFFTDL